MNFAGRQWHGGDESRHHDRDAAVPCDPDNLPEILDHLADVYLYLRALNSHWPERNSAILTLFNAAKAGTSGDATTPKSMQARRRKHLSQPQLRS
ncbi:MAG TPA: hypothetical protein VFE34_16225 [Dongiaceae bacterium]|jgi:hypothetical protein|nr:hypothetical protein [Dongiaceae bacterium]